MECITLAQAEPYVLGFFAAILLQRLWIGARHHLANNPLNKTIKKD